MNKDKAILIAQAVQAGTAHVFISEKSVYDAMDEAISALDKVSRIEDLVEGTIDHFDRDDALDLLYEVKRVIGK
jgi:hypothetical protein